ncbi:hypothetical protein THMIRHAS_10820 [Thiosulfatimonas sediminis]|uniref:Uncharacterized protein n=1 Tax=Thiosulfatimonas sediminis TaxID=2675054 RepID=A0A6F8PUC1_9GAMM|nr:hypothetical protein THMIRHAS_10820 [Thiosulfatimonas sediminis]
MRQVSMLRKLPIISPRIMPNRALRIGGKVSNGVLNSAGIFGVRANLKIKRFAHAKSKVVKGQVLPLAKLV